MFLEGGESKSGYYHANITFPLLRLEVHNVRLVASRTFFGLVWQLWTRIGQPKF